MKSFGALVPLAAVATSALLLTACGSSGGGGGGSASAGNSGSNSGSASSAPTSPAGPGPSSSGSSATTGSAASKATLQKIVLQASDLPAGYKATAPEPDSPGDDMSTELATCTGVKGAPDSHKVSTAQSQDFALNDVTISSEFSSYQSQDDVTADVAQIKSPKINTCLNAALKSQLAKSAGAGSSVTGATITVKPGSNGGPSNVAALASGTVNLTVSGQKAVIYVGIAFVTGKQLDGTLMFIGINQQLDAATQSSVLTAVAKRAQDA